MVKSCYRAHESTKNTQKTLQDDAAVLKSSRRSRLHESIILCEQVVLMQARAGPRHSRLHESITLGGKYGLMQARAIKTLN